MSEAVIPKERLTAYQRWELQEFNPEKFHPEKVNPEKVNPEKFNPGANFDHGRSQRPEENKSAASTSAPHVKPMTAAALEQIQHLAHEEGYQAGIKQARDEARQISAMLSALHQALSQVDQDIAQDLLNVALAIAQQVIQQSLAVKPELLLHVVREAIGALPHFSHNAHLVLHPDDALLLRGQLGEHHAHNGWKIFEDPQIERGGCRVETAHSQIDATLATRWKRVVATLGQEQTWLNP